MYFFFIILKLFYLVLKIITTKSQETYLVDFSCDQKSINNDIIKLTNCKGLNENANFHENLANILSKYPNISALKIQYTTLSEFIPEICNLKNVQELNLKGNALAKININCLNQLTNLKKFVANSNNIKTLENGSFDNLIKLEYLDLSNNSISHIGLELFTNENELKNLKVIDLSRNKLNFIEPWPIIRSQMVDGTNILLNDNNISFFKNSKNWHFPCNKTKQFERLINLSNNKIEHLMDFVVTFFTHIKNSLCFYGSGTYSKTSLTFEGNPLNCDCIDFKIHSIIKKSQKISLLDRTYCNKPSYFVGKKAISINLEDLICELSGEDCLPSCSCLKRPVNSTFKITCSNDSLTKLPESLPSSNIKYTLPSKYELIFSGNKISEISNKSYFLKTSFLDLSNSSLKIINDNVWAILANLKVLYLHSNLIENLPKNVEVPLKLNQLSIYNNPLNCECKNKWMIEWFKKYKSILVNSEGILCNSPYWLKNTNLLTLDENDFCIDPYQAQMKKTIIYGLIPLVILFLIVILLCLLVRRYKVKIHVMLNFHPFDRDECEKEDMEYDVFISSAYEDRDTAILIINILEMKNYKVCYHEKDFIGGQSITENIVQAVFKSKRVVCIVTENFLNSSYCMYEFQLALQRNIQLKRKRLIVILNDNFYIGRVEESSELKIFLKTHTYIEFFSNNSKWIDQLLYSMPINKFNREIIK